MSLELKKAMRGNLRSWCSMNTRTGMRFGSHSFLLIWSATHTGVSTRARLRGVSPSLFTMSMSAPLDRNNLQRPEPLVFVGTRWSEREGRAPLVRETEAAARDRRRLT
ncbi:hypothetical protein EYF80_030109 [Liparis tanakae]|uniref:Uncharacterized protein n=1 Tax=Liparis tanakae TaxID=230148 RepID=A0A4Z2H1K6_9TELE|nr:hypothetical protein EYF80_030109 [Liparis tanakae]